MDARVRKAGHPMPEIAAFVAKLREAFGDEVIDGVVKRGKAGEPDFFACENGRAVGTATEHVAGRRSDSRPTLLSWVRRRMCRSGNLL